MEVQTSNLAKASMDDLTPLLFDHLIARVIDLDSKSATKLQLLSSRFFDSTSKALYEELSLPDDIRSLTRPSSRSRLEAVIRFPNKYSKFVRAVTITPKPRLPDHLFGDDEKESNSSIPSYFTFQPNIKIKIIGNVELLHFLAGLESLEAFTWSTDRIIPSEVLSSLSRVTPALSVLSIRPKLNQNHESNQLQSPNSTQSSMSPTNNSPIYSFLMGSVGTPPSITSPSSTTDTKEDEDQLSPALSLSPASNSNSISNNRSDLNGISSFPCLRELELSNLSMEGARNLTVSIPYLPHLEHLVLDFTFVEDALLCNLKEFCKGLKSLRIRTNGTKTTDKSILTLLESSTLQSLHLSSVEGRLTKKLWSKISFLPNTFQNLKVSFEEVGNHHSWVTDHLNSIFDVFGNGHLGLKSFGVERIYPLDERGHDNDVGNGTTLGSQVGAGNLNSLGLGIGISNPISNHHNNSHSTNFYEINRSNQAQIQSPSALGLYSVGSPENRNLDGSEVGNLTKELPLCNHVVSPRPFPREGIVALQQFGRALTTLDLDFWSISVEELKLILESCPNVEELKVLVNSTLGKIVAIASTTSQRLPSLQIFTVSITENNLEKTNTCLAPTTSQVLLPGGGTIHKFTSGDANIPNPKSVNRRNRSTSIQSNTSSIPDLSPSTSTVSHLSGPDLEEIQTPSNSPIQDRKTLRRGRKKSVGDEVVNLSNSNSGIGGNNSTIGIDSSVSGMITKRELKKLNKRCPNLKILRWIGRGGKGEWHISLNSNKIEFFPIGIIKIGNGSLDDPNSFDPSLIRRKTSSTSSLKEKLPLSVNALLNEGVENPGPFLEGAVLNPSPKSGSKVQRGRDFDRSSKGKGKRKEKDGSENLSFKKEEEEEAEEEEEENFKINRASTDHGKGLSSSSITSHSRSASTSPLSSPKFEKKEVVPISTNQNHGRKASLNNQETFSKSTTTSFSQVERLERNQVRDENYKRSNYQSRKNFQNDKNDKNDDGDGNKTFNNDNRRGPNLNVGKSSNFKGDRKSSFTPSNTSNHEVSPQSSTKPIPIPGSSSSKAKEERFGNQHQQSQQRYIPGAPPELYRSNNAGSGSNKSISPPVSLSRSISRSPDNEKDLEDFGRKSWSLANAAGTSHINARGRKTKPLSKMTSKGGAAVGANSGGGKKN